MNFSLTTTTGTWSAPLVQQTVPQVEGGLFRIRADEELAEYKYQSRTSEANGWTSYHQTPSVYRFYPTSGASGDFRVHVAPLLDFILRLNNETSLDEPKCRYLTANNTALFNNTGWDNQAYISMTGNLLLGTLIGDWLEFVTLTPSMNTGGMSYATHSHLVHRFDIVGIRADGSTFHTAPPPGEIYYPLVTREGRAYIPKKYVAPLT